MKKYYEIYLQKYLNYPLNKIIKDYKKIESDLLEDILNKTSNIFRGFGFVKQQDIFSSNNHQIKVGLEFCKSKRLLMLNCETLFPIKKNEFLDRVEIKHFGSIRELQIKISFDYDYIGKSLLYELKELILGAYRALEVAFTGGFKDLRKQVFNNIYTILDDQLINNNKEELIKKYWFFISEKEHGYYYFDSHVLKNIIEHFKSQNIDLYSPIELSLWIMSAPLPFDKSLTLYSLKNNKNPVLKKWEDIDYITEATKIYLAERYLFNSKSVMVKAISSKRGYTLSIACPGELSKQILEDLNIVKDIIDEQFTKSLRNWSPYIKTLNNLTVFSKDNSIAEFIGVVLGKVTYTWITSIN